MGRPASYNSKDSDGIAIGANLFGLMKACMEMRFFDDKEQMDKCFYEVTEEQAEAILAILKPDGSADNKAHLTALIGALGDPACADEKAELCALLSADISFSGSGA